MTTNERKQELPESALDHLVERNHLRVSSRTLEACNQLLGETLSDAAIRMLTKRAPWEHALAKRPVGLGAKSRSSPSGGEPPLS